MQRTCTSSDRESLPTQLDRKAIFAIVGVILLYWLALAPIAVTYLTYHPDERHYTDGAILMVHTGDYLTPRDPDGTPRFLKPVICYWLIAASYQLFGISAFSSRLPFLMLGGGVIGLASILAWRVTSRRRIGFFTSLILATNPLLILASISTLTDIIQIFCLLISLDGWLALLRKDTNRTAPWKIIVGTGLAVATKGIPGLLLTAYAILFCLRNPWRKIDLRRAFSLPMLLVGIGLASAWYLSMFCLHGTEAWACFFDDQVSSRAPVKWWHPLLQLPASPLIYFAALLPWSWPLFTRPLRFLREKIAALSADQKLVLGFLAGWPALLLVPLTFVSPYSPRYFLLAAPMLAILCAWAWNQIPEDDLVPLLRLWKRPLLFNLLLVLIVSTGVLTASIAPWIWPIYAVSLMLLAVVISFINAIANPLLRRVSFLTAALLISSPFVFTIAGPFGLPDQAQSIAASLERRISRGSRPEIWFVGKPAMAAKMRVYLQDPRLFHAAEALAMEHLPTGPETWVICRLEDAEQNLDRARYEWSPASSGFKDLQPRELFSALCAGQLNSYLANHRQIFVIAQPRRNGKPIQTASARD